MLGCQRSHVKHKRLILHTDCQRFPVLFVRMKSQILDFGFAGACTIVVCNAAYFSIAYAFVWLLVLQVPRGTELSVLGVYVGKAAAITYATCQATKFPRILGILILVPFVKSFLGGSGERSSNQGRYLFIAVLTFSVLFLLIIIAGLLLYSL